MYGMCSYRGLLLGLILLHVAAPPARGQMHRDYPRIGARDINNGEFGYPNRFNLAQECLNGLALDTQMSRKLKPSNKPEVAEYLQHLAEEISLHSDFNGALRTRLCRSPDKLAFATMGGYLYVDEQLFRLSQNESELAGVLAHEIGHLAARHCAENLTRNQLLEANPGWITTLLRPGLTIHSHVSLRGVAGFWMAVHYRNEFEADELGTQYLWNAGFDPEGLLNFLSRLEENNWLDHSSGFWQSSSHPTFKIRQKQIRSLLRLLPTPAEVRIDSSGFIEAQNQLRSNYTPLSKKSGQPKSDTHP